MTKDVSESADLIRQILKNKNVTLLVHTQKNNTLPDKFYQHFVTPDSDVLVISIAPITDFPDQLKSSDIQIVKTFDLTHLENGVHII